MNRRNAFSDEFESWLGNDEPKTVGALCDVFAEKSFAVAIVVLMLVSAVPIPTGGISLAFQIAAIVVAAQMVLGRTTIWLPERWRSRNLAGLAESRAIRFMIRRMRWLERHSRPRLAGLFRNRLFMRLVGLVLILLAITAGLSPPLSGLEILPAMGAIAVALAVILEDAVVFVVGVVVGTAGIVLFVSVGAALIRFIRDFV